MSKLSKILSLATAPIARNPEYCVFMYALCMVSALCTVKYEWKQELYDYAWCETWVWVYVTAALLALLPLAARRIVRDEYTVPRCTAHILRRLKKGPVHFEELFSESPSRDEVVTLFLALLELLRLGRAGVSQDGVFGDIMLEPREGENLTEGELTVDGYA